MKIFWGWLPFLSGLTRLSAMLVQKYQMVEVDPADWAPIDTEPLVQ